MIHLQRQSFLLLAAVMLALLVGCSTDQEAELMQTNSLSKVLRLLKPRLESPDAATRDAAVKLVVKWAEAKLRWDHVEDGRELEGYQPGHRFCKGYRVAQYAEVFAAFAAEHRQRTGQGPLTGELAERVEQARRESIRLHSARSRFPDMKATAKLTLALQEFVEEGQRPAFELIIAGRTVEDFLKRDPEDILMNTTSIKFCGVVLTGASEEGMATILGMVAD